MCEHANKTFRCGHEEYYVEGLCNKIPPGKKHCPRGRKSKALTKYVDGCCKKKATYCCVNAVRSKLEKWAHLVYHSKGFDETTARLGNEVLMEANHHERHCEWPKNMLLHALRKEYVDRYGLATSISKPGVPHGWKW